MKAALRKELSKAPEVGQDPGTWRHWNCRVSSLAVALMEWACSSHSSCPEVRVRTGATVSWCPSGMESRPRSSLALQWAFEASVTGAAAEGACPETPGGRAATAGSAPAGGWAAGADAAAAPAAVAAAAAAAEGAAGAVAAVQVVPGAGLEAELAGEVAAGALVGALVASETRAEGRGEALAVRWARWAPWGLKDPWAPWAPWTSSGRAVG